LLLFVAFSAVASGQSATQIVGDVRIEALSPNLVRIEKRGPEGFEDRPTFHVVDRSWALLPLTRTQTDGVVSLDSGTWKVLVPAQASDLSGVQIVDATGHLLASAIDKAANSEWLPDPGASFSSWSFKDGPRLVPSKYGLTAGDPKGPLASTSGWDIANDADDVYVFLENSNYHQLRTDFLKLTGPTEMPPLFMFGLIDSRWFPYDEKGAIDRIDQYRKRKIPLDVLVLDTDWRIGGSAGYVPDRKYLPNITRYFMEAHAKHVKTMFNDHPEPKAVGALDPVEMNFRTDGLSRVLDEGLDVWWYDRNWYTGLHEPLPGLRKEAWGMKLYHDVTQRERPASRPVIMANVDGIDNGHLRHAPDVATHRYPVQWTGDTTPDWGTLKRAVANALEEGVHGANPYVHEDLGGHVAMPTADLYARFAEYGSLGPIMRFHCTRPLDHAPWVFGPEAEKIATDYIKLRYRLLPLIYSNAYNATANGEPLVRRLDLQYPGTKDAQRNDQFLVGHDLLVAPIVENGESISLPASLFHTPDGQPGLKAEYFANQELQGSPAVVRTDPSVDFDWGQGSPDPKIPPTHFSARWTGTIGPMPAGKPLKLSVTADDGVRMWIDGKPVVDEWHAENSITTVSAVALEPGSTHELRVEFYQELGDSLCRLQAQSSVLSVGRRSVWIPNGSWTDVWSGKKVEGPQTIEVNAPLAQMPMYLRAGAIIPLARDTQYTGEHRWSPLTLEVFPTDKVSSFTLYEDDGQSVEYRKGGFRTTRIYSRIADGTIRITIEPAKGEFEGQLEERAWKVRVHLPHGQKVSGVEVSGSTAGSSTLISGTQSLAFPLLGKGPAAGDDVLEIMLTACPVSVAQVITVK
jgi:hypothetical protein